MEIGLDIDPETIATFRAQIEKAQTTFWNGPTDMFEIPSFKAGTTAIVDALADRSAITIVGGNNSVAGVKRSGRAAEISHISTGGGATLEFLAGKALPGVAALEGTWWG